MSKMLEPIGGNCENTIAAATRRRSYYVVREAARFLIAAAFLMGLLLIGNCVGQVS